MHDAVPTHFVQVYNAEQRLVQFSVRVLEQPPIGRVFMKLKILLRHAIRTFNGNEVFEKTVAVGIEVVNGFL